MGAMSFKLPRVTVEPVRLDTSLWSDCPTCHRSVNECGCDPEDYAAAVYAQLSEETPAKSAR